MGNGLYACIDLLKSIHKVTKVLIINSNPEFPEIFYPRG